MAVGGRAGEVSGFPDTETTKRPTAQSASNSPDRIRGAGLALAGLILGYIGLSALITLFVVGQLVEETRPRPRPASLSGR